MTAMAPPIPKPLVPPASPPIRKRWTVAEFHRLWEDGWFEGCKPMLVGGEIYLMPIPGPAHSKVVGLADYALKAVFAAGFYVRVQIPLVLGQRSDPVPDIAVVTGSPRDYDVHPTTALLVVEVSDTSLAIDTGEKAQLYAASGVADYWVVDVNARQLLVYRDPRPDPISPFGSAYATVATLAAGQTVSPLAQPNAVVNVSDLLP
jgi:Uma2 family endonuclease